MSIPYHRTMEGKCAVVRRRIAGESLGAIGKDLRLSKSRMVQCYHQGLGLLGAVLTSACFRRVGDTRTDLQIIYFGKNDARIHNCLKNGQITTVAQLRITSDETLLEIPNLGLQCLEEIRVVVPKLAEAA